MKVIITYCLFLDKIIKALHNHFGPPFSCHVIDRGGAPIPVGRPYASDRTLHAPPGFSG